MLPAFPQLYYPWHKFVSLLRLSYLWVASATRKLQIDWNSATNFNKYLSDLSVKMSKLDCLSLTRRNVVVIMNLHFKPIDLQQQMHGNKKRPISQLFQPQYVPWFTTTTAGPPPPPPAAVEFALFMIGPGPFCKSRVLLLEQMQI